MMSLSNIAELRASLIGNKDLKFKLFRDVETLSLLKSEFEMGMSSLVSTVQVNENDEEFIRSLDDLESRTVIIKMVCLFSQEVESSHAQILSSFQTSIGSITSYFKFYMEIVLPLVYQRGRKWKVDLIEKFERISSDLLDILLALLSHRRYSSRLNGEVSKVLWRWVTTLSVIIPNDNANGNTTSNVNELNNIVEDEALFLKSLKLVPLLLFDTESKDARDEFNFNVSMDGADDDSVRIVTLLSVLIGRLGRECDKIYSCHFPGEQMKDPDEAKLDLATFNDPNLPNIEPSIEYFKKNIQIETLLGLICCIAQIFSFLKESNFNISGTEQTENSIGILPPKVYLSLLLLLKYENIKLNLVTLNLIYFFLNNLTIENKLPLELVFKNYQKLFPRINELISTDEANDRAVIPLLLLSPCKILAQLCTNYPLMNNDLRRGNLEIKLIGILESLFETSPQIKLFKTLKKSSMGSQKIVDFGKLASGGGGLSFDDKGITNLPDLMLLLSVYCSKKEEYRSRIVATGKNNGDNYKRCVSIIIFEIIDNYRFLLSQIQMIHMKIRHGKNTVADLQLLGKLLSIMTSLLNDSIYTNTLYLIRSLSRSVALLRTFFVKCNSYPSSFKKVDRKIASSGSVSGSTTTSNIISAVPSANSFERNSTEGGFTDNLLHILKGIENCSLILNYYNDSVSYTDSIVTISRTMISNKSILLKILANLVLDFSSLRFNIIRNEEVLDILIKIFKNSSKPHKIDEYKSREEVQLEANTIQYNILQVLQNYTFNENDENKAKLMELYKFECIFEKIAYGLGIDDDEILSLDDTVKELRLQQKVHSFDVLRNLTSGSQYFCQRIQKEYSDWKKQRAGFAHIGWYSFLYKNLSQGLEIYGLESGYDIDDDFTLMELCKNESYTSLLLAINYIEDHKYTNIENFKENLRNREKIFHLWLKFLSLNIPKDFEQDLDINVVVNMNNNLSLIQVSICWIIINLTWKNEIFGSRRTDSVQFKIYDTISIGRVNDRIDIDSEDDDEDDDDDDENNGVNDEDENAEQDSILEEGKKDYDLFTSASNRAMFLRGFGFLTVLDHLVKRLNGGHSKFKGSERFDSIMGNDLLEKARSAKNQILELTGGKRLETRRRDSSTSKKESEAKPGSQRTVRPDVNRGGEGYGYETDSEQEYVDTMENNDSDMEGVEEFDEYWVR
ncbi:hypothetical protein CLIB1423_02S09978 [[Candida] railenensis]|uniref:Uncharacterized protein n=1 Tax=[Candida] railenensis TaxID=45579 RepID=A0A9P0QLR1_9ASCO|nr:hypothetical protein CLIB1423_02S09978 [[Candida] railenensis]